MLRTAASAISGGGDVDMDAGAVTKEIMLFGVRVVVDPMRKSVSMNNLSQYEHPPEASIDDNGGNNKSNISTADRKEDAPTGYASADDAVPNNSARNRERERKRGVPWTEEEHKLFLLGLQKVGKGDWRGISRNFVKTRTPTQVASHAQKYFLRRSNLNRRRRRSSLFDITTDTVKVAAEEEQIQLQDNSAQLQSLLPPPPPETCNINGYHVMPTFPLSVCPSVLPVPMPTEKLTLGHENLENDASSKQAHPLAAEILLLNATTPEINLNLKSTINSGALSLNLALASDSGNSSMKHPAFRGISSMSSSDNIISVA